MTTPKMRKTLLASSLFLLPGLANALGLGAIDVKSALNEPLNAEIELVFASPAEQESLTVQLAREEDFQRVGLDASRVSVPLQFSVDRGSKGKAVIRVTSDKPVKDPALTILLEVNWGAGRLLREYSILLDPPLMAPAIRGSAAMATAVAEPAPAAIVESPAPKAPKPEAPKPTPAPPPASPPPAPVVAAAPAPKAETPKPAPPPAPAPIETQKPAPAPVETAAATPPPPPASVAPAQPAAATYGPVDPGKNLLQVAREVAPGSPEEMNRFMVAVLRTNPQSFYQDNVNALKRGAVLTLPTQAQLTSITPAEAADVVRTHNDLWQQYAQSAAAQPTRLADTGSAGAGSTGTPAAADPDSRLELVPPRAGEGQGAADAPGPSTRAGNAEEVSKLRRDLQLRQEELTSAQNELDEMRSRVKDLEGLKGKQDALIKLKDDEIAQLQARLADVNQQAEAARLAASQAEDALKNAETAPPPTPIAAAPAIPEPAAEPTPEPVVEPVPEPAAPAVAAGDQGDAPPADDADIWGGTEPVPADGDTAVSAAPEPPPAEPVPAPAPVPPVDTPVVEPEPAPTASGGLFSLPVIGGLLALLAAGIGAFFWQRSRGGKPDRKDALPPIMPSSPDDQGSIGIIDPEEDLRDRIAMNPTDLGAHLELVRYLHSQHRTEALDAAAEAMYRYVSDPDCDEWREVANLTAELQPGTPHFDGSAATDRSWDDTTKSSNGLGELDLGMLDGAVSMAPAPAAAPTPAIPDFKFEFDTPAPAGPPTLDLGKAPAPAPAPALAPAPDFDFNFDNLLGPAPAPAAAPAAPNLDFDLGSPAPTPAPVAAPLDFGFDLDTEGPTRRVEPVPAPTTQASVSDFSFDFDSLLSPAPAPAPMAPPAAVVPPRTAMDEQRTDSMALPDLDSLMNSLGSAPAPAPSVAPAANDLSLDLGDMDLNFGDLKSPGTDFLPVELETRMPPQPASALEHPEVIPLDSDFNLDDPGFLGGDDAIATKLDLARAYIDMSDPDGARAMLEEVLTEGSDAQKSEAREILGRIG